MQIYYDDSLMLNGKSNNDFGRCYNLLADIKYFYDSGKIQSVMIWNRYR